MAVGNYTPIQSHSYWPPTTWHRNKLLIQCHCLTCLSARANASMAMDSLPDVFIASWDMAWAISISPAPVIANIRVCYHAYPLFFICDWLTTSLVHIPKTNCIQVCHVDYYCSPPPYTVFVSLTVCERTHRASCRDLSASSRICWVAPRSTTVHASPSDTPTTTSCLVQHYTHYVLFWYLWMNVYHCCIA